METETIILYVRIFPDLLDSSLSDVEKRLEGLGKVLFALDGGFDDYEDDDIAMHKIDMRSPQSAAVALYTFYVKVSRSVCWTTCFLGIRLSPMKVEESLRKKWLKDGVS